MATRNSIESTLVRFARHLHARRGLAEATVHNYVSAIRRLAPVIGLQPTPKAVEQQIERMHKAGASYSHIVNTSTDNLYGTFMFYPKPSDTNWVLSASQSTVSSRNTVTLTAMVTADPHVPAVPTGTVTFYDGCTVLGTANVNTATGAVSLTATLPAISGPQTTGQHTIQAIYGGDMNFFHNNSNQVVVMVQ